MREEKLFNNHKQEQKRKDNSYRYKLFSLCTKWVIIICLPRVEVVMMIHIDVDIIVVKEEFRATIPATKLLFAYFIKLFTATLRALYWFYLLCHALSE